jgi:DNA-binding NarL/FixJ family response regulator
MVILDIRLPHTNSFDLLEYIVNMHPKTKVLIFSMSSEGIYGKRAITAGAHGYLSKESSLQELKKAIFTILENKSYISGQLLDNLLNEVVQKNIINPFNSLSRREFEITTLLLSGLSITEIAEKVHLQTSTIGTYKSRIFDKLGVSNLIHLKELAAVYNFY